MNKSISRQGVVCLAETFWARIFLFIQAIISGFLSALIHIFTYWIGGSNNGVCLIDYDEEYSFDHKPINPFGWPYGVYPEWTGIVEWNFHQIAYLSGVYDACLRLNEDSPWISTGASINGAYKTDLRDSGDWEIDGPFPYTGVY